MSMILYAFCLNPLLKMLEEKLPVNQIGRRALRTSVVAYADDVTIVVKSPRDLPVMSDATRRYERVSGAYLNPRESKSLAIGGWSATETILGIAFNSNANF